MPLAKAKAKVKVEGGEVKGISLRFSSGRTSAASPFVLIYSVARLKTSGWNSFDFRRVHCFTDGHCGTFIKLPKTLDKKKKRNDILWPFIIFFSGEKVCTQNQWREKRCYAQRLRRQ